MTRFFISRPIFAISLALAIVMAGLVAIMRLPIEQYPDITPPVVEVTASYEGADAQTVNDAVATPLAESIMGTEHLLYVKATSSNDGEMVMQATFDIGSDPDTDAILTQNNLSSATALLPEAVTRQGVETRKSMTGFLMVYALHSDGRYNDEFLSNYAYLHLQSRLQKIEGVGKVSIMGAGEYAMRIWLKPDVLRYYGLSVREVTSKIREQSAIYPAGQLGAAPTDDEVTYTYTVSTPRQISSARQFADIIVRTTPQGEQIRLGDIATVELGSQSYGVKSQFGDSPSTLIVIYQQPGSNAMQVAGDVRQVMAQIGQRLPEGVAYTPIIDTTQSISAGVGDIFKTLIIALLLVIVIIYLFLGEWRATLIPVIAIPVSLIGAFTLFPIFGFSINIISLLGLVLAIGLVVDDAIVVVEAVQVNIAKGETPQQAALHAMKNVTPPIIATTVVLMAVFIPVSLTGGISGRLFQQFSVTILMAVVLSAVNALTLSPALAAGLLRPSQHKASLPERFDRLFTRLTRRYTATVPRWISHIARTALFTALVAGAAVGLWEYLPQGFLPEEDEGYVMVAVSTPEASSLDVTLEAMRHADNIVAALPDVESTSFAAGYNMLTGIASTNSGIIFAQLKDYADRRLTAGQTAERLNGMLYMEVPEAECFAFIPPSIPGLGTTSGIEVEVQDTEGKGTAYLAAACDSLIGALRQSPLIASVTTQFDAGVPHRQLKIDSEHAEALDVDTGALYAELSALLGGEYINNFTRYGRLYRTYVQAAPEYRADKDFTRHYFIPSSSGKSVPLATFAQVTDTVEPSYVAQFNLYRSIALTVIPRKGASTQSVMEEITLTPEKCCRRTSPRPGAAPRIRKHTPRRDSGLPTSRLCCSCSSRWPPSTSRGRCRWPYSSVCRLPWSEHWD